MGVLLIPFVLILLICWYMRENILLHNKSFPRGFLLLFLVLGIVPVLNVAVLIGIIFFLVNWSINDKIELRDTKIDRFLKG